MPNRLVNRMKVKLYHNLLALATLSLALLSCAEAGPASEPVAEVGDAVLTKANLVAALPVASSAADSAVYADDFIRSWVYRQVLLQKAEIYLANETEDIEAAVEEYRSSLIIETYQNMLIDQKFVSDIKPDDVSNYYDKMKQNFVLRESIVKGMYAVFPSNNHDLKSFLRLLSRMDDESYLKVEEFLFNHTKQYKTFFDNWTPFSSVQKFFPQNSLTDALSTIASKPYVQIEQDGNIYLLKITQVAKEGVLAPLDFVKGDITNILTSQQKLEFISSANRELYDQALKAGHIKFYETND